MECWVDGVSRQRWGDAVARRKPPQATPALCRVPLGVVSRVVETPALGRGPSSTLRNSLYPS